MKAPNYGRGLVVIVLTVSSLPFLLLLMLEVLSFFLPE